MEKRWRRGSVVDKRFFEEGTEPWGLARDRAGDGTIRGLWVEGTETAKNPPLAPNGPCRRASFAISDSEKIMAH